LDVSKRAIFRAGRAAPQARSELAAALAACRRALIALVLASALVNILYLTGSLYMLEVYDRVLPSRSIATLIGLSILVLALYGFQALLDVLRGRILIRVGRALGQSLSLRTYETIARLALHNPRQGDGLQPIRDLDQVRAFLSGTGPVALLDMPWLPLYIAVCFAFHTWLGVAALVGAILLVGLTLLTEAFTKEPTKAATALAAQRNALAESSYQNAEVLHAMGMAPQVGALWNEINVKYLDAHQRASDVGGTLGAISKVMRMVLQSAMLGIGALLVIQQQATAGVMIAASIIVARALAPVDLAIANWRSFVAFRESWRRLNELLKALPDGKAHLELPKPVASLSVEGIRVVPPGGTRMVVQDVTFRLTKGSALGIVGPSASGKSSLARALVGIWQSVGGAVRLDEAKLDQWAASSLGRHVGYLPQDVQLFSGTVAQNIARLESEPPSQAVIAAATAAGVHEMILHLPDGYETEIGEGGAALSAGQQQRIALARALYGEPFLVVLDEPNSNLDTEGKEALTKAIAGVRARGGIAIVIAHRPSALASVDLVLVMIDGRAQFFGPRDEALGKLRRQPAAPAVPLKVVSNSGEVAS
jgi:PrtD family type I secretion system ABC transporter